MVYLFDPYRCMTLMAMILCTYMLYDGLIERHHLVNQVLVCARLGTIVLNVAT